MQMVNGTNDRLVTELTDAWARTGAAIEPSLVAQTREALGQIGGAQLHAITPLVNLLCEHATRPDHPARSLLIDLLDRVRRRVFTESVPPSDADPWARLISRVVDSANFTFPELLTSRERTDPDVVALRVLGAGACSLTVAEVARRTRAIARGLLSLLPGDPDECVAVLSENNLETALCDLACLANGIVNVRVPANAVASHVEYILQHAQARVLIVSQEDQIQKVLPALGQLPALKAIVVVEPEIAARHGLLSLDQLVAQGGDIDDGIRSARAAATRSRDLATVMYTSGTTGLPKGIMFSHRNIVSKRFCRGLALPSLGEGDVFLSYLPLYHTFGRWFELTGTLYWGATYVFARSPSQASLLEDFQSVSPTVFISVPKKWMELHECAVTDAGTDEPGPVADRLRILTGGRLRFGVSAAGYLDPIVFRSVERAGVRICSGYGMTEATGGITMTPPGGYRDGSIGKGLPGIDLAMADDGELRIRGPYVMMGYFRPPDGISGLDQDGWFATGDIVSRDDDGYYHIVDRKKEIYKNRKGQTIVPQRVENLFRDFDVVGQAFLVGDHREYNTLLLWPNVERMPELASRSPEQIRAILESLVVSANRFLARYERIVAFEVLPRPLSEDHDELTPKGTFKRKVVEENWRHLIEPMYRDRNVTLSAGGRTVLIPNWVLREIGALRSQVTLRDGVLTAREGSIAVGPSDRVAGALRIGDYDYATEAASFDFGSLLATPELWIGNDAVRAFIGAEAFGNLLAKERQHGTALSLVALAASPPSAERIHQLLPLVAQEQVSADSAHAAAVLMDASDAEAVRAIAHLERGIGHARSDLSALCRAVLRRGAISPNRTVRRLAFRALLAGELEADLIATVKAFLRDGRDDILDQEDLAAMSDRGLPDAHVSALLGVLSRHARAGDSASIDPHDRALLGGIIRILGAYAVEHLAWYARVRFPLARLTLADDPVVAARAGEEIDRLQIGFRAALGPNLRLAVDPETGKEYGWSDVLVFDENVCEAHREPLRRAIIETGLVRESVFIFGKGVLLSLADVAPRGLWISLLGTQHGKSVYRLSVQTRSRGAFDIAINLAESLPVSELREEIRWLMSAGDQPPLVEEFGGYFAEHGIFTEEFIPGETVDRQVARLVRQGAIDRLRAIWPFLVWNAMRAHADFWDRSARKLALATPAPSNFIIPSHDYQVGARLVSISSRSACTDLHELLSRFQRSFVEPVQAAYPQVVGLISPVILLSAFVEAVGLDRGLAALASLPSGDWSSVCASFVEAVNARGFTPQRVYFACQRYARWMAVNPGATLEARGQMLQQLWETYRLEEVEASYPDTRIRFFRQTVFLDARDDLARELDRLMALARQSRMDTQEMSEQLAAVRGTIKPTAEEDWFLARLTFRHLRPTDEASLVSLSSGTTRTTDVEVTVYDAEGARYRIRGPVSPREVAKLLTLFHQANLSVTFTPEHEYLVVIDDDDQVVGGLYYGGVARDRAYLEKIVVARKHRRKGISDGLMNEFFRRLKSRGVRSVVTGYFRPEYLHRFGFKTEPSYSGLVRDVVHEPIGREERSGIREEGSP